jgi:hypothetical protein
MSLVWKHLGFPSPTKRQYEMGEFLQYGPRDRKLIEGFRGVAKSLISEAFVAWLLLMNPRLNIEIISATKSRADNFATVVKQLINEMPVLRHLQPREGQRSSRLEFDVAGSTGDHPSVKSAGITGQITGTRADVLILDDVEIPNNSATQMMREKLAEQIKEAAAIIKPGGHIIYLGTPQTESSIYNLLPERGYLVRIWPILYPNPEQRALYGERLAEGIAAELDADPTLVGKSTEPARFTADDIAGRRLEYGEAGFALQFMLDTSLSDVDKYPLKLRDLLVAPLTADMAPERCIWAALDEHRINDLPIVGLDGDRLYRPVPLPNLNYLPYTGKVMAIDPSGRGKDETAYAVVAMLNGLLYLLDAGGFASGYADETLEGLANIAKAWNVNYVLTEANFGDGMFTKILQPVMLRIHPCKIEEVRHSQQKEKRIIDTLEPVVSQHRLIVNHDLIDKDFRSTQNRPTETATRYQLFNQFTRVTRDRGALLQDDRLDALAIAVAYWTQHMARDVEKAAQSARDKLMEQELKKFVENAKGKKGKHQKTWIRA